MQRAHDVAGGVGFDFSPMFARVAPILSAADLAVCHLESPIAPPGEPLSTFPNYGIPAQIAPALAAGVRRLLDDAALSDRLSRTAATDVRAYTWDRRGERLETLLQQVTDSGR